MTLKLSVSEALAVERELIRNNLSCHIQKCVGTVDPNARYLHNWHIDAVAEYLTACYARQIKRLIINIPPGYLKSISGNVGFPSWVLGHNPKERILSASYAESLSKRHSRDCRLVMNSDWYRNAFPKTRIDKRQNEQLSYSTTLGGRRQSVSFGGMVTGLGGNILIVDDPHNVQEALSDAKRGHALDWFDQGFTSRLRDKENGIIIVIMQRLHQKDLTAHLLEQGIWEHLSLPAEAEERTVICYGNTVKVRDVGDILHKEREDAEKLHLQKISLGSYGYAGQYQQRPAPKGGGMFKLDWLLHYSNRNADGMNVAIIVDPAGSKKSKSDFTSMTVVGLNRDNNIYVLDLVRDRLNLKERTDRVFELHYRWRPSFVGYEKYGMQSDIEHIQSVQEQRNYRFAVHELNDGGKNISKPARVERLLPLFEAGRIYLPEYGFFVRDTNNIPVDLVKSFVEEEYLTFPYAAHDDMLDSLARITDPGFTLSFPKFEKSKVDRRVNTDPMAYLAG